MKYLVILFLFISPHLLSQVLQVEGFIKSRDSNKPIQFINVSIQGQNIFTETDEQGYFSLKGNFTNEEFIVFRHVGYIFQTISLKDFISSDKTILLDEKIISSQTILVKGSIGTEGISPISFSKIKREELQRTYTTQDFPEALSFQPSINFYSESGNGLGYNYLSIRGFDQRRISVSINGIPQNDPEDHNVYWIDFPDLLESTELIQVQRGAGSGIIGYPAIGGAVNIITTSLIQNPKIEFSASLGNFNTRKYSMVAASGLIKNKYSIYIKLSQTLSSGYRDLSWVDLKSYYISVVRIDQNLTSQVNIYGGPLSDGLAYTGLPKFAIKDRRLRTENFSYWESDGDKYTFKMKRRLEEFENFSQPHFEIMNELKVNENLTLNSALFLVMGEGFFDYDASWADTSYFRLTNEFGYHPTLNPSNAIIRAMVDNKQWGWIPRVSYKHPNGELIIGGEFRFHRSIHWGGLKYVNNLTTELEAGYRYYQYEGAKDIFSMYFNENYNLNEKLNLLVEAQLVFNKYRLYNEKYLGNDFSISNIFFNPRLGLNYNITPGLTVYFSVAQVLREPRLKNYYDAAESSGGELPQFTQNEFGKYDFTQPTVLPEKMTNLEVGGSYNKDNFILSLNGYLMLFSNEIVKQGQLDRFGQPITGNMKSTIHYGFETSLSWKISHNLEFVLNGSLSKDYISEGITFVETKDAAGNNVIASIDLKDNLISGFPSAIINSILRTKYEHFYFQLSARYVGRMYTDNYSNRLKNLLKVYPSITSYNDNIIDPYVTINLFASYEVDSFKALGNIKLYIQINNLLDSLYAAYGIGGEFFPAAERNLLIGLKVCL